MEIRGNSKYSEFSLLEVFVYLDWMALFLLLPTSDASFSLTELIPPDYEKFSETMFKRFYWQGYHGGFASLRWPTRSEDTDTNTIIGMPSDKLTFNRSEHIAFESGTGAAAYFWKRVLAKKFIIWFFNSNASFVWNSSDYFSYGSHRLFGRAGGWYGARMPFTDERPERSALNFLV